MSRERPLSGWAASEWTAPFPGSSAAKDAGCICPILDNGHGDPGLARDRGGWVIFEGCPLHPLVTG